MNPKKNLKKKKKRRKKPHPKGQLVLSLQSQK
jgi:hypothetical protein